MDWGRTEQLGVRGTVSQIEDDTGSAVRKGVEAHTARISVCFRNLASNQVNLRIAPVSNHTKVQPPFAQSSPEELPLEFFVRLHCAGGGSRILLQTSMDDILLFSSQEAGRFWAVGKGPRQCDGNDDGEYSFEDENPAPSGEATNTIHLFDREG